MSRRQKKLILALAVLFALNIFIIALAQSASADLYKKGSSGAVVREIQTRLKNWGYYSGAVDGVYGSRTEEAVRWFQRKNGLSVDGQVGNQTLAALGISPTGSGGSSSGELQLLARLISEHPSFPNSIAGVIYQPGAFSCLDDGQFNEPVSESAYRAARDALGGYDPSYGAIYYFNPATATSKWIWSRPLIVTIGSHRFCS